MTLEQEKTLLEDIKSDSRQFGVFFDHYYKPIFGYIYRRVTDYDLSRDIAAETFLRAFLKIKAFEWKGISVSQWLYKIATNEINSFFRTARYKPYHFGSILDLDLLKIRDHDCWEVEKLNLEEELKQHNEFLMILDNLKKLDTKYQDVIALRYFEDKEIKEISAILGKPEGTVKSLISRGLDRLRKMISCGMQPNF